MLQQHCIFNEARLAMPGNIWSVCYDYRADVTCPVCIQSVSTCEGGLNPIWFHVLFFFPVYMFMFQIWSVPLERIRKSELGHSNYVAKIQPLLSGKTDVNTHIISTDLTETPFNTTTPRPNWRGSGFSYVWFDQSREVAAAGSVWQVQKPKQPLNASLLKPPTWFHYRPTL